MHGIAAPPPCEATMSSVNDPAEVVDWNQLTEPGRRERSLSRQVLRLASLSFALADQLLMRALRACAAALEAEVTRHGVPHTTLRLPLETRPGQALDARAAAARLDNMRRTRVRRLAAATFR
jgi:hypothetical protein